MSKYLNISFLCFGEKQYIEEFYINLMRFFWIPIIGTMVSIVIYLISQGGLEFVISFFIIDITALRIFSKTNERENGSLKQKIENLEKSTYDLFNKLNRKSLNIGEEKKELTESLDKF